MYHIANTRLWTDCHIRRWRGWRWSYRRKRLPSHWLQFKTAFQYVWIGKQLLAFNACWGTPPAAFVATKNIILMRIRTTSVVLLATKTSFFFMRSWTTSGCFCGSWNRLYFHEKSDHLLEILRRSKLVSYAKTWPFSNHCREIFLSYHWIKNVKLQYREM